MPDPGYYGYLHQKVAVKVQVSRVRRRKGGRWSGETWNLLCGVS